jgi:iron complex outermembrane receptor protein
MHGDSDEPLEIAGLQYLPYNAYYGSPMYYYNPKETLYSYAAYGQFRYKITDDLRLTLAGRYTLDHKQYFMDGIVLWTPFALKYSRNNWGAFTPRVVLDYSPDENTLVYASYSRGFKAGGFNTLGDVALPINFFKPEFVTNYEVGTKLSFFDQRLRLGLNAFYLNYTNLQQPIFVLNPQNGVSYPRTVNASNAIVKGAEFEIQAVPVQGLQLIASVTRLHGRYGTFINMDLTNPTRTDPGQPTGYWDLKGNSLPQAPDWQVNLSGSYSFTAFDNYVVTPRIDYRWQSKVYFDIYNHPADVQGDFQVVNTALTLGTVDSKWALTAYMRNVFDKRYVPQVNDGSNAIDPTRAGTFGEPRVMGLMIGYKY